MDLPLSLQIAIHYLAARLRQTWGAERLRRYQERRARQMVRCAYEHSPFYRAHWAGYDLANWQALPPVNKRLMMANFDRFTTRGVRADAAMQLALRAERERDFRPTLDGLTVGLSSGTSGHRGLFVVSPAEQAAWAGTILARVLPGFHPRARPSSSLPPLAAEGSTPSARTPQSSALPPRGADDREPTAAVQQSDALLSRAADASESSTHALPSTALPRHDADTGKPPAAARHTFPRPPRVALSLDGVPAGGRSAGDPPGANSFASLSWLPSNWRGYRVAFFLRSNSNLYEQTSGRLVRFRYFDLMLPLADAVAGLNAFQPDIIVGPPSLLEFLAACQSLGAGDPPAAAQPSTALPAHVAVSLDGVPAGGRSAAGPPGANSFVSLPPLRCTPELLISVAEVLEPQVAAAIAEAFQAPVRQVYQCTEGLLAVSCAHGALHIQEDLVALQLEPLPEEGQPTLRAGVAGLDAIDARPAPGRRFTPIVTDLHRSTQPIIRYQLGDVLQLDPNQCPCGSAFRVIRCIEGRADDVLYFEPLAAAGEQSTAAQQATSLPQCGADGSEPSAGTQEAVYPDSVPAGGRSAGCPPGVTLRTRPGAQRSGSVAGLSSDGDPSVATLRPFYPDTLRRAVLLADGAIADYQVFQNADLSLCMRLAVEPGADFACAARGVRTSIASTLAHYHCSMVPLAIEEGLAPLPPGAKRRRVQRLG